MLEVAGEEVETLSMDHHGLVAAVCKDLKIAERIDARLAPEPGRMVSDCTRSHYNDGKCLYPINQRASQKIVRFIQ